MMAKATLQAGSFRRRVTLQDEVEVPDGCGGFTISWVSLADIWAQISPVKSQQILRADNIGHEISHTVLVRKVGSIRQGMRFLFGSRVFQIISVYDPDETGRYLRCDTRELN